MKGLYKTFSKIYQEAQELQAKEIFSFFKEGDRVLDVGCGSASLANILISKYKISVFGLDVKDLRIHGIPFQIFDGIHIPFPKDHFDGVLISFVLHHARDPISLLKEAKQAGKILIIFEDVPQNFLEKFFCWIHFAAWKLIFRGTGKFFFLESAEWRKVFENLGLDLIFEKEINFKYRFLYPVKRKMFVVKKLENFHNNV
jgi:SAM-dependent methyltransferase